MSSNKLSASTIGMAGILLSALSAITPGVGWANTGSDVAGDRRASQAQAQPRDPRPRPAVPGPASSREQELRAATIANPAGVEPWLELAKLQEARGATEDAEATFKAGLTATGGARDVLMSMAAFFNRLGQFEKTVAALEQAALENPTDPAGHQLVATYYWDKAYRDQRLTPADKLSYIDAGIAATDRALAHKADFIDALVYKSLLLRLKANLETDAGRQKALLAAADTLRNRAMELQKARTDAGATASASAGPPPAPPPPPPGHHEQVDGQQPVRVGGNIKTPTKIHDVRPVYPQEALDVRVSGMVILEAVIDTQGNVRSARVLRSIPLLDQAALDAVRQWRFTPTLLEGIAVPVLMTVTVNFTMQ